MGAIYLIRHGQASFGQANYDELSKLGVEQARVLGAALKSRVTDVHALVAGTMKRHQQTAEAALAELGLGLPVHQAPGFNEFDHEDLIACFEPRYKDKAQLMLDVAQHTDPRLKFQEIFGGAIRRWIAGQNDSDYQETWAAFRNRTVQALHELVATMAPSQTALVFTSGGPIAMICQSLLELPDQQMFMLNARIANCSVTKVIYGKSGLHVATLNEHGHFEGAQRNMLTYR